MKKRTINFHIITAFPEAIAGYFSASLLKKAQDKKIIKINLINLRDFSINKHRQIDDRPFGGGPGMVLQIEPIFKAIQFIKKKIKKKDVKIKVILFSLGGKRFHQEMAEKLIRFDHLILICGHYEGVDERVAKYLADEEISIGDFTLSGGEIPAMVITDAIARLLPGFLSNKDSIESKRFSVNKKLFKKEDSEELSLSNKKIISFPAYTRPEIFYPEKKNKKKTWRVPKVLLSGHHLEIEKWQRKNMKK